MFKQNNSSSPSDQMKIFHLIPNLSRGGAEVLLCDLVIGMKKDIASTVICFDSSGNLQKRVQENSIKIISLDINQKGLIKAVLELYKLITQEKPDILHCWMYHSNLIGGFIGRISGIKKIIWSIHSNMPKTLSKSTYLVNRLSAIFSGLLAHKIIFVSEASFNKHRILGYEENKSILIQNGINTQIFSNSIEDRTTFRNDLGLGLKDILIGLMGRNVPEKDYPNFFKSINSIQTKTPFHIALAGKGMDPSNRNLQKLISKYAIRHHIHLLGEIDNTKQFFNGLDIFVISSISESAPVALLEAMSVGVKIIVTNVGDCKKILGNEEYVCEPSDPVDLAKKISHAISLDNESKAILIKNFRKRVKLRYSQEVMRDNYLDLYLKEYTNE